MAVLEKMTANMVGLTGGGGYGNGICGNVSEEAGTGGESDRFPAGLRILVVDDDRTCLKLLERMLQKCLYQVTTCCQAKVALALLRERKGGFDLVISDVHMPDMDGFKLLEHVGLEMDLPVIMMSGDGRTSAVMRGIKHGACNYLIKPVRMEELKNIWQHVVRKKRNDNKEHENSGSFEDSDRQKRSLDDTEYASSVNDVGESCWKGQKKKRESKEDEDDGELDNDDPSASKKPRVVWSVELHQQFVSAVNQLGVEKAVPKRILELMNVPGLTRENVASHLQKFRLYLKRLSGVSQHQLAFSDSYCGPMEASLKLNQLGRFDLQTLVASSESPPEALTVALHAELLGRTSGSKFLSGLEQQPFLQPKVPSTKFISVEHGVRFDRPPAKCHSNFAKLFPYSNTVLEDVCSGFSDCSASNPTTTCSSSNVTRLNSPQNNNLLAQILPQEQSQQIVSESSHATNFQPSYVMISPESSNNYQLKNSLTPNPPIPLTVPSHPSSSYIFGNIPATINCGPTMGFNLISSRQSNASLHVGQMADAHFKSSTFLSEYSVAGSLSSSLSSGVFSTNKNNSWRVPNASLDFNPSVISGTPSDMFVVQDTGISAVPDQVNAKNLGFIGKGTCIPSRFVVDDIEFPIDNLSQKKMTTGDNSSTVKQEIQLNFVEGSKGGNPACTPSFW